MYFWTGAHWRKTKNNPLQIQMKMKMSTNAMIFVIFTSENEYQCYDFWTELVCTWKAAKDKGNINKCNINKNKNLTWITVVKNKDLLILGSTGYILKSHHYFFQSLQVASLVRSNDYSIWIILRTNSWLVISD